MDITNLRGDTPLSMLQVHAGSVWIGSKVIEKIRELNQSQQRRHMFVRIPMDKVKCQKFSI